MNWLSKSITKALNEAIQESELFSWVLGKTYQVMKLTPDGFLRVIYQEYKGVVEIGGGKKCA